MPPTSTVGGGGHLSSADTPLPTPVGLCPMSFLLRQTERIPEIILLLLIKIVRVQQSPGAPCLGGQVAAHQLWRVTVTKADQSQ